MIYILRFLMLPLEFCRKVLEQKKVSQQEAQIVDPRLQKVTANLSSRRPEASFSEARPSILSSESINQPTLRSKSKTGNAKFNIKERGVELLLRDNKRVIDVKSKEPED